MTTISSASSPLGFELSIEVFFLKFESMHYTGFSTRGRVVFFVKAKHHGTKIPLVCSQLRVKSSCRISALGRITRGSHIAYYSLMFFIAYAISMLSQPQNPEFRINPGNLHPCVYGMDYNSRNSNLHR